jgi:mono/diheme cytochrome c family protein
MRFFRFFMMFKAFIGTVLLALPTTAEPLLLDQIKHIHGITVDAANPDRLLLATHQGLFAAGPDGLAIRISNLNADFMSFAAHPKKPKRLMASGHPAKGGNLGVMASDDGGITWAQISQGDGSPVDFHALAISAKDTQTVYGLFNGLQVSRDDGVSWKRVGNGPSGQVFGLAASARDTEILYAATMEGLQVSKDDGKTWSQAFLMKRPATMINIAPNGRMYAFIYGVGLLSANETTLAWKTVSKDFQDRALMGLAVDPRDANKLYAITDTNVVMESADGGITWRSYQGSQSQTAKAISAGSQLFQDNCQACHGKNGIGERPNDPDAKDEYGFVAPALNDDAHAWHHPDSQLVSMILNGSDRNKRMIAWKETLTRKDAEHLVAYIKSLWTFRSLACQGSRHMACMQ